MNTDLLIEGLEKVNGAMGDTNWWVNQIVDDIPEITDDEGEQLAIANLLDTVHRAIADLEMAIEALAEDISEDDSAMGVRFVR